MKKIDVAIVVDSLNDHNIGRVYPFLRAMVGVPDVHVSLIGWDTTGMLFPLLKDLPWPIVRLYGKRTGRKAEYALQRAISGCNVMHCFKNRPHFYTALAAARCQHIPLVLDLDDWEMGLSVQGIIHWPRWRQYLSGARITQKLRELVHLEYLTRTEPSALTVNSTALQGYFGGQIVYTSADAESFDPRHAQGTAFRAAHGLSPEHLVIGFPGTPSPHKGIDELLDTFASIRQTYPAARLFFIGMTPGNRYYRNLHKIPGVVTSSYLEAAAYRDAYAACDIVVIPQRAVTEGVVQTPAKLILAMASGRPIVATTVGDIPAVLGDTGVLVPPGDVKMLINAIFSLLENTEKRAKLGTAAHQRFLAHFTLSHLREQLLTCYTELVC